MKSKQTVEQLDALIEYLKKTINSTTKLQKKYPIDEMLRTMILKDKQYLEELIEERKIVQKR